MDSVALIFLILALAIGLPFALISLFLVRKKPQAGKMAFYGLAAIVIGLVIGTLVNSIIGMANYDGYYHQRHACSWVALGLSCGAMGFGLLVLISAVIYHFLPENANSDVQMSSNFDGDFALITASGNVGVGLWTSICIYFAAILGVESKNYTRKMDIALNKVRAKVEEEMKAHPEYEYRDFRVVKEGNLAYTGSVMGIKKR